MFRMGFNKHYPEETPVHRVTVNGFWIDRTPVTNRQLKQLFVRALATRSSPKFRPIRRAISAHCRICSIPARLFSSMLARSFSGRHVVALI
jgi:hypothetical protein